MQGAKWKCTIAFSACCSLVFKESRKDGRRKEERKKKERGRTEEGRGRRKPLQEERSDGRREEGERQGKNTPDFVEMSPQVLVRLISLLPPCRSGYSQAHVKAETYSLKNLTIYFSLNPILLKWIFYIETSALMHAYPK